MVRKASHTVSGKDALSHSHFQHHVKFQLPYERKHTDLVHNNCISNRSPLLLLYLPLQGYRKGKSRRERWHLLGDQLIWSDKEREGTNSRMHEPFLTRTDVKQNQTVTQKQKPRLPKHLHIQPVPLPKQEKKKSKAHPKVCHKLPNESYSSWKLSGWSHTAENTWYKTERNLKDTLKERTRPSPQILGVNTKTRKSWNHHRVTRFVVHFSHKQFFLWIIKLFFINSNLT